MTTNNNAMATNHLYASTLFGRTLGSGIKRFKSGVRAMHDVRDATVVFGSSDIDRGTNLVARLVGWLFGFPPSGRKLATVITVVRNGGAEIWYRRFAGHPIMTQLEPAGGHGGPTVAERFAWRVTFDLQLLESDGRLRFELCGMRVAGVPMPRLVWPILRAEERAVAERFVFDIDIALPFFGPLIHYRGWVRAEPNPCTASEARVMDGK